MPHLEAVQVLKCSLKSGQLLRFRFLLYILVSPGWEWKGVDLHDRLLKYWQYHWVSVSFCRLACCSSFSSSQILISFSGNVLWDGWEDIVSVSPTGPLKILSVPWDDWDDKDWVSSTIVEESSQWTVSSWALELRNFDIWSCLYNYGIKFQRWSYFG